MSSGAKTQESPDPAAPEALEGAPAPSVAPGSSEEPSSAAGIASALPTELPTERPSSSTQASADTAKKTNGDEIPDEDNPGAFAGLLAEAKAPKLPEGRVHTVAVRPRDQKRIRASSKATLGRVVGPYQILEEIGSGGMAVVHKAIQPTLDRLVALKELRSEYVHDKQIATRFEREATSLATLQHGNIVHVYDFLKDRESAFIVMEYVEGIDLFDVLAETERVPPELAGLIALQVAEGLEYAHYRGIVHRDIKPSNIFISKTGEVKIMDFGIARDPGKSELTQVGLAVGTPAYMAPEQIRGDKVDFRTDVFALGIVIYEMLAGEKPWIEEEGRSITVKVLDDPPIPLSKAIPNPPPELEAIVHRCLAKSPDKRFASTDEVRRALQIYVQNAVPIDPRARLVLFMRNRGFITDGEASNFVPERTLNDPNLKRVDQGIPMPPVRQLLRPLATIYAGAAALLLIAVVLAVSAPFGKQLAEARPQLVLAGSVVTPPPPKALPEPPALPKEAPAPEPKVAELTGDEGFLKIVVKPWARVFVDAEFHDHTPFARPITLSPGKHRIGLRNPYYKPEDRMVVIEPGKTHTVKVALEPKDQDLTERP